MRAVRSCGWVLLWVCVCSPLTAAQPAPEIPVEVLQARRSALFEMLGSAVAVIRSADLLPLDAHPQASDFRQANDFYYFTGLEAPRAWLVLVARESGPDSSILYLPPRNAREERWTGPTLGPGPEALQRTGVSETRSSALFGAELERRAQRTDGPASFFLPPKPECDPYEEVRRVLSKTAAEIRDLAPATAALRIVKDSVELARLRRAAEITVEAQREAMAAAQPGMYEYELEALIEYAFRRRGAERVAFPSIIGSGPNSVILHYDKNRRRMQAGDLVVVDVGADVQYYAADVTRTFPVSGTFTPRQREIYELVLAAQQAAIEAARPGVSVLELDRIARRYLREHSRGLCGRQSCDEYFVHGIGHWLGMDVHDVGDYTTPLRPGMVLTIEPGVYLADEALGVRIEDDLLITEDGAEVLTRGAPRAVEEIEAWMRQGAGAAARATGAP